MTPIRRTTNHLEAQLKRLRLLGIWRRVSEIAVMILVSCFYGWADSVPCQPPPLLDQKYTWPQGQKLTINIDPAFAETNPEFANAVQTAIDNWNSAAQANGSGVTISTTSVDWPPKDQPGQVNIFFSTLPNVINADGSTTYHLGQMTPTFTTDKANLLSAAIGINKYIKDPATIAQIVAHELGHTFGLDDCPKCPANSSVMATPDVALTLDMLRGTNGPTDCDNAAIKQRQVNSCKPKLRKQ